MITKIQQLNDSYSGTTAQSTECGLISACIKRDGSVVYFDIDATNLTIEASLNTFEYIDNMTFNISDGSTMVLSDGDSETAILLITAEDGNYTASYTITRVLEDVDGEFYGYTIGTAIIDTKVCETYTLATPVVTVLPDDTIIKTSKIVTPSDISYITDFTQLTYSSDVTISFIGVGDVLDTVDALIVDSTKSYIKLVGVVDDGVDITTWYTYYLVETDTSKFTDIYPAYNNQIGYRFLSTLFVPMQTTLTLEMVKACYKLSDEDSIMAYLGDDITYYTINNLDDITIDVDILPSLFIRGELFNTFASSSTFTLSDVYDLSAIFLEKTKNVLDFVIENDTDYQTDSYYALQAYLSYLINDDASVLFTTSVYSVTSDNVDIDTIISELKTNALTILTSINYWQTLYPQTYLDYMYNIFSYGYDLYKQEYLTYSCDITLLSNVMNAMKIIGGDEYIYDSFSNIITTIIDGVTTMTTASNTLDWVDNF